MAPKGVLRTSASKDTLVAELFSEDALASLLKMHPLVVVDVTASWCGPCKAIAPKIEALAKASPEIRFTKVQVENVRGLKIGSVPTFLFYKNSTLVYKVVGSDIAKVTECVRKLLLP